MAAFSGKWKSTRIHSKYGSDGHYPVVWAPPSAMDAKITASNGTFARKLLETCPLNGVPLSDERRAYLFDINVEQERDKWLRERLKMFGATDVVKIVGLGYSMSPCDFARQCAGLEAKRPFDLHGFQCMQMGQHFESIALAHYRAQTGWKLSETGYNAMPLVDADHVCTQQPWLEAWVRSLGDTDSDAFRGALKSFDVPYLVVTPDALVDMRGVARVTGVPKTLCDLNRFYGTGAVEVKTHKDGIRTPRQNKSAVVQMLAQALCVEIDEGECDRELIRTKWIDLCSYSCVTPLSRAFSSAPPRNKKRRKLQTCAAWRISVLDPSIFVTLCDMIRAFRESLDTMTDAHDCSQCGDNKQTWVDLDLWRKLRIEPIFRVETDDRTFLD